MSECGGGPHPVRGNFPPKLGQDGDEGADEVREARGEADVGLGTPHAQIHVKPFKAPTKSFKPLNHSTRI